MSIYNGLNGAEEERLALLVEECGEVIQAVGKVLRHGYDAHSPSKHPSNTNRKLLETECGQVQHSIEMLTNNGELSDFAVRGSKCQRGKNLPQWLHCAHDWVGDE